MLLFGLFWGQFVLGAFMKGESGGGAERIIVSGAYLLIGLVIFVRERGMIGPLIRDGFRTSFRTPPPRAPEREMVGE
jgi:hypothetical protein